MKENNNEPNFVKLVTVFDQFKVGAIKGLLEDSNIPYIEEASHDKDSYMIIFSGWNMLGTNIYVPDYNLEEAQNLVTMIFGDDFNKNDLSEKR
ncbi:MULTISPECIES: DUF2007 domain-containing protein [Peptoniphilus]|uniref:putative signal transducing protein n=1 Tax=Peptoniphilus TaxID=162289 RepID=UPI0001DA9D33|nr:MULTISPECIES: DUF2007 domain-containing protein [Peptoniphilus]EFI41313.1 hypothetical protein HMPREF0629_01371 [Peptoniphilus sp. oral taxon 386 str. F0131]